MLFILIKQTYLNEIFYLTICQSHFQAVFILLNPSLIQTLILNG